MIIDVHQHITYARFPQFTRIEGCLGHGPFTARHLLKDMDKWGIDKSVVLPLANPENLDVFGVAGNQEVIAACARHPDRLIPFFNIDPRGMLNTPDADFTGLMRTCRDLGCRGIGEICANMPVTDRRCANLFHHAGQQKMPVLFHLTAKRGSTYGLIDKPGLPGLEEVLKAFPNTLFIGHAPAFWNEIDGDLKRAQRDGYPKGPIEKDGALWHLMETYPNLHADMSAGSGHNALTRDPEAGIRFLRTFHRKVFFGTDQFFVKRQPPIHLTMMQEALAAKTITKTMYENMMHRNFTRVFGA